MGDWEEPVAMERGQRRVGLVRAHRSLCLPFSLAVDSVFFRLEDVEGKRTYQERGVSCSIFLPPLISIYSFALYFTKCLLIFQI